MRHDVSQQQMGWCGYSSGQQFSFFFFLRNKFSFFFKEYKKSETEKFPWKEVANNKFLCEYELT
jgi:hypothetical protein